MRTRLLSGIVACTVLLVAPSVLLVSGADQSACALPISSGPSEGLTDLHVSSTKSWIGAGSCQGATFYSQADTCPRNPTQLNLPVAGAYCGPIVQASESITCRWQGVASTVPTRLYIGFDWDMNGILELAVELPEKVWGPMEEDRLDSPRFYTVTNTGPSAQMIAYPTNVGSDAQAPTDESIIGCVIL